MIVYSHRGIDFDRAEKLPESSLAAFRNAAEKGCGIELDLQLNRENVLVIEHDATGSAAVPFSRVIELAREFPALELAVHLKGYNQSASFVQKVNEALQPVRELHSRILIFDLQLNTAKMFRAAMPYVNLAPSVADAHDIARFQKIAHGTLYALEDVIRECAVCNWLWLDEWDRTAADGGAKTLYTDELFTTARKAGFKIAVISPELHKAENHQDAADVHSLEKRWREIAALKPDAICTDYPARLLTSLKIS